MHITSVYPVKVFPVRIDLAAACVAHYKMNDDAASTVVIDSQGYSDGTAQQNTEDINDVGKINGALSFNGTSDYVDCNDAFEPVFQNSFTINFWCKPNDGKPPSTQALLGTYNTPSPEDAIIFENRWDAIMGNMFRIDYFANGVTNDVVVDVPTFFIDGINPWTMITGILKKISETQAQAILYVNGSLYSAGDVSDSNMIDYSNIYNLYLGCSNGSGSAYNLFDGLIDNVMIFNKALSQAEIDFLYNSGNGIERLTSLLS